MFIFSHPVVRKKAYNYFWCIHQLYVLLYIFSLLHGLARKVHLFEDRYRVLYQLTYLVQLNVILAVPLSARFC